MVHETHASGIEKINPPKDAIPTKIDINLRTPQNPIPPSPCLPYSIQGNLVQCLSLQIYL